MPARSASLPPSIRAVRLPPAAALVIPPFVSIGEAQAFLPGGMAPGGEARVFLVGVHAVVDEEVCILREVEDALGLRALGLVVGEVGEAAAPVFDPEAHGRAPMDDRPRDDRRR